MNIRLDENRKIIKILSKLVEKYPEQRFGQLICNYVFPGDMDPFYEESAKTLSRIEAIDNNI